MSQVLADVLFECSNSCPIVRRTGAESGFIMPNKIASHDPKERLKIAQANGLAPVYRYPDAFNPGKQCLEWKYNGANGETGECYLKGGSIETR